MRRSLALLGLIAMLLTACSGGSGGDAATEPEVNETTADSGEAGEETEEGETGDADREARIEAAKSREEPWVIVNTGPGVTVEGREIDFTVAKMPIVRAMAQMREDGWNAEARFIEANETAVQALVQGEADAANIALPTILAAVSGDAPLRVFGGGSKFGFVIVGKAEIESPDDADGMRVAYQAPISAGTLAARLWVLNSDAEPQFLTMAGSSTRVEALLAGELDAAAVSLGFDEFLQEEAPGEFATLYRPIDEYPFLLDTVMVYSEPAMNEELRTFLEVFHAEHSKAVQELQDNPEVLTEWQEIHEVPVSPPAEQLAEFYFTDIGVSADAIDQQVELMVETEQIESTEGFPTGADLVDPSIWEAAEPYATE